MSQELPQELIIEILKFTINKWKNLFRLSLICKDWNNAIKSECFSKYLYLNFFSWRQDPSINNSETTNYYNLLQKEVKFWLEWNFHSLPNHFKVTNSTANKNQQQYLLTIERINSSYDYRNIITKPILYNTGIYYFEITTLKNSFEIDMYDLIFVGFIFNSANIKDYNKTINFEHYLSSTKNQYSLGIYFADGDIYGGVCNNFTISYMSKPIKENQIIGVYLDTNKLTVRFILGKQKFNIYNLGDFIDEKGFTEFKNGNVALYPAISLFYEGNVLQLNSTASFKSIKKAKWIKDYLSN